MTAPPKSLFNRPLTRLFCTKSLVNKTGIVLSIAKSDEIGKIAHLIWCKVSRDFVKQTLNQAFMYQKVWLTKQVS